MDIENHRNTFVRILKNHLEYIDWEFLCENPAAIEVVEENPNKIKWESLCLNPAAIHLIKPYLSYRTNIFYMIYSWFSKNAWIHRWRCLSTLFKNPAAIEIIEEIQTEDPHLYNILRPYLLKNKGATHLIKQYQEQHDWDNMLLYCLIDNVGAAEIIDDELNRRDTIDITIWLSICENLALFHLFEKYQHKFQWNLILTQREFDKLCANPAAIHLIEKELTQDPNSDKISWHHLSSNPAPAAINLLRQNPDKIDFTALSSNPSPYAIEIIEEELNRDPNSDKICWRMLSLNPGAINLLEQYSDKINWVEFMYNRYNDKYIWYCENILNKESDDFVMPIIK